MSYAELTTGLVSIDPIAQYCTENVEELHQQSGCFMNKSRLMRLISFAFFLLCTRYCFHAKGNILQDKSGRDLVVCHKEGSNDKGIRGWLLTV